MSFEKTNSNPPARLSEDDLEIVVGGGNNNPDGENICQYCSQTYSGDWGQHMKKCPNNPFK